MERFKKQHLDFLDPIRGMAILVVFVFHCLSTAFGHDQLPWAGWFRDFDVSPAFLALLPVTYGWVGVAIFFVVSGFCIHLSFARQPEWRLFFQRRFYRIYPPYLIVLLFFAVLYPLTRLHSPWQDTGQLVSHVGLFHNLDERWFFGINPSFWSIAIEVQLYALYPLLILLTARIGWRRSLLGIAALEITLRLTDGILLTLGDVGLPRLLSGSPFIYWLSWSLGAFLAERHLRETSFVMSRLSIYAAGIAAVGCSFFKPLSSMSFVLFALLTAGIISQLLRSPGKPLPIPKIIRIHLEQIGLWSFSLYLLHQPLIWIVPRLLARIAPDTSIHPLLMFCLCLTSWVFIVPLARLSYRYVELPSVALGKRFHARKALDPARQQTSPAPAPPVAKL